MFILVVFILRISLIILIKTVAVFAFIGNGIKRFTKLNMNQNRQRNRGDEFVPLINSDDRGDRRKVPANKIQNKANAFLKNQNLDENSIFEKDFVVQAGYDKFVITKDDIISTNKTTYFILVLL